MDESSGSFPALFERLFGFCGFLARQEPFPTSLDTSSSRDLYSSTMVGGVNCHQEAQSATTAETQILFI